MAKDRTAPSNGEAPADQLAGALSRPLTAASMNQSMETSEVAGSADAPEFSVPVAEAREVGGLPLAQPMEGFESHPRHHMTGFVFGYGS